MYFKPRIFISSSLCLNTIGESIKDVLEKSGAEVILYQKDLVPSINESTYLQDVLESDFVIFILDEFYGAKNKNGISQTHEEWQIAFKRKIPKHVYILRNPSEKQDEELEKFIKENINQNDSAYYYDNEDDLLNRIRATTFTIAKDIVLSNYNNLNINDEIVCKLAYDRDYKKALDIIKLFDDIIEFHQLKGWDLFRTNIVITFSDRYNFTSEYLSRYFINDLCNYLFVEFLDKIQKYSQMVSIVAESGDDGRIHFKRCGLQFEYCINKYPGVVDYDELLELEKEIYEKYNEFKEYIIQRKANAEINL